MVTGVLGLAGTLLALASRAYRDLSRPFVDEQGPTRHDALELGRA